MGIIQSICFCLAHQTPGGRESPVFSEHLPHVIMSYPPTMVTARQVRHVRHVRQASVSRRSREKLFHTL